MPDHPSENRLRNLLDGLTHNACTDAAEAESELREAGLDPEEVKQRGLLFVQRLQGQARLELAKTKRQALNLAELRERVSDRLRDLGHTRDTLQRLLAGREDEFDLSFRKIEALDPEDVAEVLSEAELLRLLDELEDEG